MKKVRNLRFIIAVLVWSLILPATVSFSDETTAKSETVSTEAPSSDPTGSSEKTEESESGKKKQKKIKNGFDEAGNFHDSKGDIIHKSTIRNLLEVALKPVGKTMYVWGGGWNRVETGEIGVSPKWEAFFNQQTPAYNYRNTRYQTNNGLDCSGFVGWVLYNTFNTESGHGGYVMLAQLMAKTFSDWGWGSYSPAKRFKDQKAGDIMSLAAGHVYIVIGRCSDGSLVLVHSSPKGVMINGTVSKSGKKKSKAWKLARQYMRRYYPEWYAKYPDVSRGKDYLRKYSRMSWNIGTKNSVMSDPEGLRNMSAEAVLKVIFHE